MTHPGDYPDAMTRRASPDRQRAAFIQGGQREIARGGRPHYRIRSSVDGWALEGASGLTWPPMIRADALATARTAIAELLEVAPDRFDIEVDDADVTTLTPPKRDGQVYGG